jgi:hypothetical protein
MLMHLMQRVERLGERVSRVATRANFWRSFWAAMILSHVPSLASVALTPGQWLDPRILFLVFSQAFFVLKLLDVPWLRLRADRNAWIAVTLAFTLLHADLVVRNVRGRSESDMIAVQWIALMTATVVVIAQATRARATTRAIRRPANPIRIWLARCGDACQYALHSPPLLRRLAGRAPPA